ncbi:MAG: hypothetical protein A2516_08635 [Alphaproteobacteria bacterium RIFOXYD12_FULL_60_8]|nr:MAG: hypothetical protein A2516_08635 [Alphaproteobacteria bacterium RIFOXYD12_FULL_60_8]
MTALQTALKTYLLCPNCGTGKLMLDVQTLACGNCESVYKSDPEKGFAILLAPNALHNSSKTDIQKWWGDLYAQLYKSTDANLTSERLLQMVDDFEDMMRQRLHLVTEEMPLRQLANKRILEIGPGGGGHCCLFKKYGAEVVAVDITVERALSTAGKLSLMAGPESLGFNADGENLPFADDSFDIVYSNGVLHHSENTDKCIAEVCRVLKPGGKAVIMLYSRHSATFWLNIVPRAIITGEMFRWPEPQWIGRLTEGTPKHGDTKNPFTRVYSAAEMRRAFAAFDIKSLRKSSFQFDNFCIPKLTQLRAAVMKLFGRKAHPGGVLVYGSPFMNETALELWLGKYMGFAWNIVAEKPMR